MPALSTLLGKTHDKGIGTVGPQVQDWPFQVDTIEEVLKMGVAGTMKTYH